MVPLLNFTDQSIFTTNDEILKRYSLTTDALNEIKELFPNSKISIYYKERTFIKVKDSNGSRVKETILIPRVFIRT